MYLQHCIDSLILGWNFVNWNSIVYENSSFLQRECLGVVSRATCYMVDTGLERWKGGNCWHTLQWTFIWVWRWLYLPPSTLSAVNCKLPWGLIWKMLRVCTVVCVILFVPYSLCLPQQINENIIPKICGLNASYQWLLYIHPDLMVTSTSTCHILSNVYTSFTILCNVWPKIVPMTYGVIYTHTHTHTGMCVFSGGWPVILPSSESSLNISFIFLKT